MSAIVVRALACVSGLAVVSFVAASLAQPQQSAIVIKPAARADWIEIARPHAAFALTIPEAADAPAHYTIHRHASGGGRKDILTLGAPDSAAPFLHVEIYRPGRENERFADPASVIAANAIQLEPGHIASGGETLASKLGPLSIVSFIATTGTPRRCLGFVRAYDDPRLQISGWFCQGGDAFIERDTLACALDRLSLLSAGSEPKTGALFAQAELNRSFCGQRSPLLAPTPKHRALWAKTTQAAEPGPRSRALR